MPNLDDWTREADQPRVLCAMAKGVRWRIYELEQCQRHLGLTRDIPPEGITRLNVSRPDARIIFWKLHTESTTPAQLQVCTRAADRLPQVRHINDPRGWLACHAKEVAFAIWQRHDIPCPQWFEFRDERSFKANQSFDFPMLIRVNNSTGGRFSWLVRSFDEVRGRLPALRQGMAYHHDGFPSIGVGRKIIAVQYIPTERPEGVNLSFRIIVAGNRVVTGYARVGPARDWIAITNRFEPWMEEPFIAYQRLCQQFCEQNEQLVVKAVKVLGLNFQGVDVILDRQNRPYFLEVQPGFSVGYADRKAWHPPFYNPTRPASLVKFLIANRDRIKAEAPLYHDYWLDKHAMFDRAFRALAEVL